MSGDDETDENIEAGDHSKDSDPKRVGRRGFVLGAAGLVVGTGLGVGARPAHAAIARVLHPAPATTPATPVDTTRRYVSSQATISSFDVWKKPGATLSPGYLFSTVTMDFSRGVIFDDAGEPVWIEPNGLNVFDLRVQEYQGRPVLTFWAGTLVPAGYGHGVGTIVNDRLEHVATVKSVNGISADLHEFLLTSAGTALLTSYPVVPGDLSSVGGPKAGYYLDCHIQEIDVATGALVLDWRASDHIALEESYQPVVKTGNTPDDPYDPFHVNAVDVDTEGDGSGALLVSARHTHTLYSIDRVSGAVNWRINGKKSDFTLTADAVFAWQHHVTRQSPTMITIFDNHYNAGKSGHSRGLVLKVDERAKTVGVDREYTYDSLLGTAEGSVQHLDSGNVLVGWGMGNAMTEFTADGTAVYNVGFQGSSYRSFRSAWSASPAEPPAVAAIKDDDGTMTVYASWNGATEVTDWRFETGASVASLATVTTTGRAGFETSTRVPAAQYVRAVALDADGTVIGTSPSTRV